MSGGARTRVDLTKLERRLSRKALAGKQEAFARRVAFEMRDYVPEDSGYLKDSEPLASDYGAGTIEWSMPYAKIVYDMPASSIHKTAGTGKQNPRATSGWTEAAKRERGDAWREFAAKLMTEE